MVAPGDPTDTLLLRYADPSWRDLEADWQRGRLTARECMARQVDLIRMTPADLFQFVKGLTVDPDFPAFVDLCQEHGAGVTVVSDGMDFLVGSTLRRAGLDVPFFANELEWQGGDRWKLRFPHLREACRWKMGNCKCSHLSAPGNGLRVMVGDGRSDFCIAGSCDYTLAKGALAVHCRENNLPHTAIANFAEAIDALAGWLSEQRAATRRPAAQIPSPAAR